ncbi:MAG TPA: MucR family transcriptional regulator [Xanthobacteraceae bacterium]|nr:MucR family transcriptional regulator [Xanthobacteraceae bacterium]
MKERVSVIVSAYVGHNTIAPADLPVLITSVNTALSELGQAPATAPAARSPAVPVWRSVTANAIVCLDCGWSGQMLWRHLTTAHNLTPQQYRERWKLPATYTLVAKHYSHRRSQLAKSLGLGTRDGSRKSSSK